MNISILFEICIAYALLSHSHISGGCTGEYTDDDRDDTKKIALPPMCTCVCIHLCMQQIYRCECTYESSQDDFTVLVFICLWVCACAYLHQGCRYDGVNLSCIYVSNLAWALGWNGLRDIHRMRTARQCCALRRTKRAMHRVYATVRILLYLNITR